jgi:hypothetical protein
MGNLSAALIRPQLPQLARRVADGRRNHDHVAERLSAHRHIDVPSPLPGELRAPDSIQFNLKGLSNAQIRAFAAAADSIGVKVQVFGQSTDNARAFWNWQFVPDLPVLPRTRAMLMSACDVRLPVQLSLEDCDRIADAILGALTSVLETENV